MGMELIKRTTAGISFGGIYFFIVLTFLNVQAIDVAVSKLWMDMIGCMAVGIYFGAASLLFDIERWSRLTQTIVHSILSLSVFFPIAVGSGWIPLEVSIIVTCLVIFVTAYAVFWFGAWLYYKRLAQSMNRLVQK